MANIYVRSTDGSDADNGLTWALAKATLQGAIAIAVAGDTIWVSQAHAETTASSIIWNCAGTASNPINILCGNDSAEPPTALATTASITSTASYLTLTGNGYVYGVTFSAYGNVSLGTSQDNDWAAEQCTFFTNRSGASTPTVDLGPNGTSSSGKIVCINCTFKFATGSQGIRVGTADVQIIGAAFDATAQVTNTLVKTIGSSGRGAGNLIVSGSDLSNIGAACDLILVTGVKGGSATFRNCKLPASWTGAIISSGTLSGTGFRATVHNCDNAATNYKTSIAASAGTINEETTIVRTGGASNGTTALAWKLAASSGANLKVQPLISDEIVVWNEVVGSSITATVEVVHDSQGSGTASRLTNGECYLQVQYLSASGVPLATFITDAPASIIAAATDQTDSAETWTTTGLTTPLKQKLAVSFTPQTKGYIHAKVFLCKPSATVYVDPKITVS